MPDWPEILQAQKSASTVLVLFVPSVDRFEVPIEQEYWVVGDFVRLRSVVRRSYRVPAGARRLAG